MTTTTSTSPAPAPAPSAPAGGLKTLQRDLAVLIELTRTAAGDYGRPDLVERIDRAAARHADRELTVLVVGEFKQGKSTLVNALLNAPVCGVADDVSTVVPTIVRYGADATATVVYRDDAGGEAATTTVPFNEVAKLASEQGNPGNRAGIRSIEVSIPRKLLQPGLTVVDTPGVGGLDSTHGAVTTAALGMAEVILFVSDASQPLTNSELGFLRIARQRCPNVVLVQTKTDIQPNWRKVVELNRAYLQQERLSIDVLPVSSVLRQRATAESSAELNEESGYPPLLVLLRDAASGQAARLAARTTLGDVQFVLEQMQSTFDAERLAIEDPASAAELVGQLEAAKAHADQLRSQSAKWQQTLSDGAQDLTADLDHDLRVRVRAILSEAEAALDDNDPAKIWEDFEQWLHHRLGFDLSTHHQLIALRADELAAKVADHFATDEAAVGVSLQLPVTTIAARHLESELDLQVAGLSGNALAAVRGSYGGLLMFGMFGQMVGLAMLNPLSVVVGLGLGRRTVREEKRRQLTQRQQQAKMAVRKYLDDVNVEAGKVSRDTTRRVHRELRDEFAARAEQLQATIRESLRSAEAATKQATVDQQRRLTEVRAELDRIGKLQAKGQAVATALGPVGS